jgi:F420-dependent oxidoreductase-like protein
MQLSLMIEGQNGVSWEQWLALAAACETHGIETLFRSDHYLNLGGAAELGSLDAWGTLCALAASTRTLRLGTMVSPATFRHPSELAKLVTTADHVSGGRVELGLGAGWNEPEHSAYGFPFPPLRTRMDLLAEQLAVVHGNWSAGPFSFSGSHYTLDGLVALPRPVQSPHPPLLMGGAAGPRAVALAARYADEYNTVFPTVDEARERRERVLAACSKANREAIAFSVMTCVVVGEDDASLAARATAVEQRMGLVPGSALREPPAGWIVGTVESVAAQLRALGEVGVDRVLCQHLAHEDTEMVAVLGERVAPLVA